MMAAEGLAMQLACRVLAVSESGYYARRTRARSTRSILYVCLTGVMRQVHAPPEAPKSTRISTDDNVDCLAKFVNDVADATAVPD